MDRNVFFLTQTLVVHQILVYMSMVCTISIELVEHLPFNNIALMFMRKQESEFSIRVENSHCVGLSINRYRPNDKDIIYVDQGGIKSRMRILHRSGPILANT